MELIQLSDFYQSVASWPANQADLNMVAAKIRALLGDSFVGIHWLNSGAPKIGLSLPDPGVAVSSEVMEEFVRRKVRQVEGQFLGTSVQVKCLQGSGEEVPWHGMPGVINLAIARVSGENYPSIAVGRPGASRRDYAWIIVGTVNALSKYQEVLLLAAAQRLASLAVIAAFEGAIQIRSQFLSIASHELKTPLTSIYGVLQLQERMLRMKKDETSVAQQERQESYLKMVIRQVKRLNELIDGLLDVSRIQNNRFMVEPSDADVAALVKDTILTRLSIIAAEAGVKLNVDAPDTLHAWVDPVRMEEVVTNMVMNAIRFSPEGGVVWIRLRQDNGSLRLTVRDQGPAVPLEDRERIFQPFERAQRTSRFGGLGLGLFISRQIAQLHGGNMSLIESLPGKGNVFEATLPLRLSGASSAASA